MKAMVLKGIREIGIVEKPVPEIKKNDEVLIKVRSVGVCGSDIHYFNEGRIGSQVVKFPFTIGHECSGMVEKTGPGVKNLKPGMKVAVDPAMSCYSCSQCRAGRYHTCLNLRFLGCPGQAEGSLSEYLVIPEASCYPVDESMPYDIATLSEPLSIGLYTAGLAGNIENLKVAVLGSGPIGISVLLMALHKKAKEVFMTDLIDDRLAIAKQMGAAWTGNPDKQNVVEGIKSAAPELIDVVYDCCGKQEAVDQGISILKPGGILVLAGIPVFDNWILRAEDLRRKEITLKNVRRQNEMTRPVLDLISAGTINPAGMITHTFGLDDAAGAFDLVAGYRDGVMKAMIHIG